LRGLTAANQDALSPQKAWQKENQINKRAFHGLKIHNNSDFFHPTAKSQLIGK
jgi:hypothetical protein